MRAVRVLVLVLVLAGTVGALAHAPVPREPAPWENPDLPISERVANLLSLLRVEEKIAQLNTDAPAVARLGVPAYRYWSEALHGVLINVLGPNAPVAGFTSFPQVIGLGATFDEPAVRAMGVAISDEGRAFGNANDNFLTFFAPNTNIYRDPRWGRAQETYSEDPWLVGRMVTAYVEGMQGDDPAYLKVLATCKHWSAYSLEYYCNSTGCVDRFHFDATVSPHDMEDTFLPAFAACVRAGVGSIMCSYNEVNGVPSCVDGHLLGDVLRGDMGFTAEYQFVVSDCDAIANVFTTHHYVDSLPAAAAAGVKAGCDLDCGDTYATQLSSALQQGLLGEADIDRAVGRLFAARFKLGMFDPMDRVPYASIPLSVIDSAKHRALALRLARESIVLLKNEPSGEGADAARVLPLDVRAIPAGASIAVIGPNANDSVVQLGNYHGVPNVLVTPLQGIQRYVAQVAPHVKVVHVQGCTVADASKAGFHGAVSAASDAYATIFIGGLNQTVEREGLDRRTTAMPGVQGELISLLAQAGSPRFSVVLLNGGTISLPPAVVRHTPAIVEAFYPGQAGGIALAEVLFGVTNPSGRLPVSWVAADAQLPPFESYDMRAAPGRTYRYLQATPQFAFGHGLSYTSFSFAFATTPPSPVPRTALDVPVHVRVRNTGDVHGATVVLLFATQPARKLLAFARTDDLAPGAHTTVTLHISPHDLERVSEQGAREWPSGATYTLALDSYAHPAATTSLTLA